MKLIPKILILASLALPIGASAVIASTKIKEKDNTVSSTIETDGDYVIMSNDDYTFTLDTVTLQFTITKGGKTWESGIVKESEKEGSTYARQDFLTSAATIYIYNSSGGESNFSIFDENHYYTTTAKITNKKNNLISAKISVIDGGTKTKPNFKMSFKINYSLIKDGLSISVSDIEQDVENNKQTLSKMILYPGFNMSYQLHNGYVLIPDGSGALIDLSKESYANTMLTLTTYGNDIGISTKNRTYTSPEQLSLPMYASVDEDRSMIVTVEEGQEYSELNSKVTGMLDQFNATYFRFLFKDLTYQYLGLSESNRKPIPQTTTNDFLPCLHYHLYDEKLEYYDIAKKYQEYLIDNELIGEKNEDSSKLRLEFLMGESKKALFGNEYVKMTSTSFIKDKVDELNDQIDNLSVSLRGYGGTGYYNSYPNSFSGISSNEYKSLGSHMNSKGIPLNYTVDVVRSFDKNSSKNAMNMSEKLISSSDYVNGTGSTFYRVNPKESASLITSYDHKLSSLNANGFDFTSIGYDLFSTYYREENTRSTTMEKYQNALNAVSHDRNIRKPNLYVYPYVKGYLDAPTSSSNFMIETESIPFLSMVLSGYKSFYSSPLNLNYLGDKQLLQLVDYNINPSYLLTENDTMDLIDSPTSSYIYSSAYDNWSNDIVNSYHKVVDTLDQVSNACFIKREVLDKQVYKNTYDNNKVIIVNYSNNDYSYNGTIVPALSSGVFNV